MIHVRYLAETIGPRGSTTSEEAAAARYAAQALSRAGLTPVTEHFLSARSAWYPYSVFSGVFLVCELLLWLGGPVGATAALLLAVAGLVSVLVELRFLPNPIRWVLPKGQSQNVWVRLPPQKQVRDKVVLLGHLDTHRTPLVFSSDGWVKFFAALVPIGLASAALLIVLFSIAIMTDAWIWKILSLPLALTILMIFIVTMQADFSPYTAGANDNATGAGVVLSLAEKLKTTPLSNTEVWAVLTGCEEVGCYGADDFAANHREELGPAAWISLDSIGGIAADPAYLKKETFLSASPSDPVLLALAKGIADEYKELNAHEFSFRGAYTEGAIGYKHGFRVLTLTGHRTDGVLPEWHRPTDVMKNIDPEVVERCETFVWQLLQRIDASAGDGSSG
jgi:Peptidase family M28